MYKYKTLGKSERPSWRSDIASDYKRDDCVFDFLLGK